MANSSGPVPQTAKFVSQDFTSPGGTVAYSVGATFSAKTGGITVTRPLEYFIGSGAVGRSYLTRVDGYVFQAPVSFYASDAQWRVSPGFERSETLNVSRPVESSCLNCHASGVRLIAGTVNKYESPPIREGGIGCERCHGAGEQHIRSPSHQSIVNPAKLSMAARDSVCAQCHLSGEVRVAKSGREKPFVPGELLSDSSAAFVWDPPKARQVNGHVEELSRSRCKLASGDKLWCGSCHDPHSTPADKASWYRERCYACHTNASCTVAATVRAALKNDCAACHMPRSEVRDVLHAAYTDHTIPKRKTPPPMDLTSALVAFGGPAYGRDLGIASALIAQRENNRGLGVQAIELLKLAWRTNTSDTAAGSQLAQLYDRAGQDQQACAIYEEIAKNPLPPPAATNNWGTCLAREGRLAESIPFWESVVARSPAEESAWINLAVAQIKMGNPAAAQKTVQRALRFHPTSAKLRELLQ